MIQGLTDKEVPEETPLPEGAGEKNYTVLPRTSESGAVDGDLLEVAMGPHHPSTHGVFRMDVALDGEKVVKLKPVFGYLHRNHEKIAEVAALNADRMKNFLKFTMQDGVLVGDFHVTRAQSGLKYLAALMIQ